MESIFARHGVNWCHRRVAADPRVAGRPARLALKFGPEVLGDAQVRSRFLDAGSDVGDLVPVPERPSFLNEGVVQDYLWSSDRALSWLAGGAEAIVYFEPSFGEKEKRPDFIIETADSVRLVELKKDGKHAARKSLSGQLESAVARGYWSRQGLGKKIQLVGLDVRATNFSDVLTDADCESVSLVWGLSRRPTDPNALWIMLYPQGDEPSVLTTAAEAGPWGLAFSHDKTPYEVWIYSGKVLVPLHNSMEAPQEATIVKIVLYGKGKLVGHDAGLKTAGRRGETSGWVAEIARNFHDQLRFAGAKFWEVLDVTAIASSEAMIYFIGHTPDDVTAAVKATFCDSGSWPIPKTYAKRH